MVCMLRVVAAAALFLSCDASVTSTGLELTPSRWLSWGNSNPSPTPPPTPRPTTYPSPTPDPTYAPTQAPTAPTMAPTSMPTLVSCTNAIADANETDIDCGGVYCSPCAFGQTCLENSDCESMFCDPDSVCAQDQPLMVVKDQTSAASAPGSNAVAKCLVFSLYIFLTIWSLDICDF